MFDCHLHSSFSGDSEMPAGAACEKAISAGLQGIAFTDHLDIDFPDFDINFVIDFDRYSVFMNELKAQYSDRLKVLKGIEVGIQPHVIEDSLKVVEGDDYDFVISSVHVVDGMDPYKGVFYQGKTKQLAYTRYLEDVLFAINNFHNYDITGHLDYIIRCACYDDRSLRYCDHTDLIDEIYKTGIKKGKGFEINTSSYREKPDRVTAQYDIELLKRYRELGGEIITLGSDAHSEEYIGYKFDYFSDMLRKSGFKYITHFEQRQPVFTKL